MCSDVNSQAPGLFRPNCLPRSSASQKEMFTRLEPCITKMISHCNSHQKNHASRCGVYQLPPRSHFCKPALVSEPYARDPSRHTSWTHIHPQISYMLASTSNPIGITSPILIDRAKVVSALVLPVTRLRRHPITIRTPVLPFLATS